MRILLGKLLVCFLLNSPFSFSQSNHTAHDYIEAYHGYFGFGINPGAHNGWLDQDLADISTGNENLMIPGVGVTSFRPTLPENFLEFWGYDIRIDAFQHYTDLGMKDNVVFIGYPSEEHREQVSHCASEQSPLFANMYEPIWDNGENDTPINDENYYALYLYKMVNLYKEHVRFWEIWNEPDFSFTIHAVEEPGTPGNWWEFDPAPCDYAFKAPVTHYVRLLRISYEVIKFLDSEAYITTGGLGYPSFLDAVLRNTDNPNEGEVSPEFPLTGGAYFDVLSFHSYPHIDNSLRYWDNDINGFAYTRHSDAAIEGLIRIKQEFQNVLERYGYDGLTFPKKLWIVTESNIPRKRYQDFIGSNEAQRNYLMKSVMACMQNDILQFHPYALADDKLEKEASSEYQIMGLYQKLSDVQLADIQLNDAGIAYKTVSDLLGESVFNLEQTTALQLPGNVAGGAFKNEDGDFLYALWAITQKDNSEDANATYSFPLSWNMEYIEVKDWTFSQHGRSTIFPESTISLTGTPQFFSLAEMPKIQNIAVDCFPNPFIRHLHLEFQVHEKRSVNIELLDGKGVLALSLLSEQNFDAGIYQMDFELDDLPKGVYFLKMELGARLVVKKVVKQ